MINITDPHPYDKRWDSGAPTPEKLAEVREILSQKFYFLAPGGQSYAFRSADDQYVLKLTKHKRMRVPIWANWMPLPDFLEKRRQKTADKKKCIFDATFKSYMIAEKYLPEETGIVFLHLNKSNYLKQKITIVDKIGIEYEINLDDFEFIIQRRAILTYPYFDQFMLEGKVDRVKTGIRKLLHYLVERSKKGVEDHDLCFGTNLAFLNDEPFQLDLGSLRINESFKSPEVYKAKLLEAIVEFRQWLEECYPELIHYFDETVAGMINDPEL
ncbi:MAG: hypothetical protein MRY21_01355 [Simkaniaceae bacterium]|nr:hypothetical protein [Simkaniaceae bacterium]